MHQGLLCDTPILEAIWHSREALQVDKDIITKAIYNETLRRIRLVDHAIQFTEDETCIGERIVELADKLMCKNSYSNGKCFQFTDPVILMYLQKIVFHFLQYAGDRLCGVWFRPSREFWKHATEVLHTIEQMVDTFSEDTKQFFERKHNKILSLEPDHEQIEDAGEETAFNY